MRAQLADGRILEFPDGTDPAVIQATVKKVLGVSEAPAEPVTQPIQPQPQQIEAGQIQPTDLRVGGEEALGTIASGIIAQPVAGAIGAAAAPFVGTKAAEFMIKDIQDKLTFIPKTPEGLERLQQIGEFLQPAGEALQAVEKGAGELVGGAERPVAAALATAAPTAALMALGAAPVRRALGISKVAETTKALATTSAKKLLSEAAPTIEGLKTAARGVYNELDSLGITINPRSVTRLSNELRSVARAEGFNKRIHPKVSAVLDEFQSVRNRPQTLTEIDTLRKVAQGAARSIEPSEARIGAILIEKIDDILDNLKSANFVNPSKADVGAKFKDARQLWRRAKKSELLEEAFEKANLQATGFENGIRTQFRSILNNKKTRRGWTSEELSAMREVVKGGTAENLAKMIGRFGFSEGQASNMLMGSLGVAGGAAVGGAPGAVAVPLIGQLSRTLAQKLTRGKAEGVDLIVRAGNDGKAVVQAYLKAVKPAERSAQELTELLLRPEINLKTLKAQVSALPKGQQKIAADAVFFASFLQSQKQQTQEQQ